MKALKGIAIAAVLIAFIGCDDGWMTDLTPPRGGWLWVVNNDLPGGTSDNSVIWKLDLPSGRKLDGVEAPFRKEQNRGLAYGDGKVWVGGYDFDWVTGDPRGYYCAINAETGERWPWVEIHTYPLGFAWDGHFLWSTDGGSFFRVDVNNEEYERMFHVEEFHTHGLAWDGEVLWAVDKYNKVIFNVDPENGEILHEIPAPGERPVGLAWDGEALWVDDEFNNVVYRVDPENGKVRGFFSYDFEGYKWGLAFEFPSE